MNWHDYEKRGWSWSVGWNPNRGGYFAQAWRDLSKVQMAEAKRKLGRKMTRQCLSEGGRTIDEAVKKLWQRLDGLDEVP